MSKAIEPEELQKAIQDYFENYVEDIEEDVQDTANTVIKEAKRELIQTSPRRSGTREKPYYKGWAVKTGTKNKKYRFTKIIWNKTNYQLTHLLEFGHVTRNGGRTKAIPHIRPVEEKYGTKFADLLNKKIRRSSK